MKPYMLDTNICSYIMRRDETVFRRFTEKARAGAKIVVSVVAYAELVYGSRLPKAPKRIRFALEELVYGLDGILSLDAATADLAGDIQHALWKSGAQIGYKDALIAAHAITANCICVTNNTREFARVPGLVLENWAA